jgi:hypothetical protein
MISKQIVETMKMNYPTTKSCRVAARAMGYSEYEIGNAFPYNYWMIKNKKIPTKRIIGKR